MKNRHRPLWGGIIVPPLTVTVGDGARRLVAALGMTVLLTGCYTSFPVSDVRTLSTGNSVVLYLNDDGRASMGKLIGPEVRAIEGSVVGANTGELTVGIRAITYINGSRNLWNGERITLQRQHLGFASRQQLSRSRSAVLAAVGASALAVIVTRTKLLGSGNDLPRDRDGGEKPDS